MIISINIDCVKGTHISPTDLIGKHKTNYEIEFLRLLLSTLHFTCFEFLLSIKLTFEAEILIPK